MNPTAQLLQPEICELVRDGRWSELREILHDLPAADTADILADMSPEEAALAFRFLLRDDAAQIFSYLTPETQEEIISKLGNEAAVRVVEGMSADDRAKLLDELPGPIAQRIVASLSPEERRVTQAILGYPPRTVGRLMTPDYIRVHPEWTCGATIDNIRKFGKDAETINVLYVVDEQGRLVDDIRLRQVILAPPEAPLSSLMDGNYYGLKADQPQEEAVQMMARYDRTALPVVDSQGVLVGMVTVDDVVDVAQQTATEEMQKMGGVEALDEPYNTIPFVRLVRKRVTWLAALFVGEMFTASALGFFESELERTVVLSLFIPLIVSSGGNSGSQASSLIIRALALREIKLEDWWKVMRRELACGLALGLILGFMGFVRIHIWQWAGFANYTVHYHLVGLTIMGALIGIVLWGSVVGAMLPFLLKKLKLDPAQSSAPFVATLVDVTGIVIYLTVAMAVLHATLLAPAKFQDAAIPAGTAEATVESSLADPRGDPFVYLDVQTDEQKARGQGTRVKVPLEGLPGGVIPTSGTRIRLDLTADKATRLEVIRSPIEGERGGAPGSDPVEGH